ncbi:hypothetical protein [Nocardia wallacei]|uniref:hypothetical protein n=1 Tax=Nocardia wallacei TaxID=480035 RepID=UPI0024585E9E|nr:hypothetical protein [Nocardia wallacei]
MFVLRHADADEHTLVVGVHVGTAGVCRQCVDASPVLVYRVGEPYAPWWLTVEIQCCSAGGHSTMTARANRGGVRPARRSALQAVSGWQPDERAFEVSSLFGRRRASLLAAGTLAGLDCRICRFPCSVTAYRLTADNAVPAWLPPIELDWCDVCTKGRMEIDVEYRPIEPVLARAAGSAARGGTVTGATQSMVERGEAGNRGRSRER